MKKSLIFSIIGGGLSIVGTLIGLKEKDEKSSEQELFIAKQVDECVNAKWEAFTGAFLTDSDVVDVDCEIIE